MSRLSHTLYIVAPWIQVAGCCLLMCAYILLAWAAATAKELVSWSDQRGVGPLGDSHRALP